MYRHLVVCRSLLVMSVHNGCIESSLLPWTKRYNNFASKWQCMWCLAHWWELHHQPESTFHYVDWEQSFPVSMLKPLSQQSKISYHSCCLWLAVLKLLCSWAFTRPAGFSGIWQSFWLRVKCVCIIQLELKFSRLVVPQFSARKLIMKNTKTYISMMS